MLGFGLFEGDQDLDAAGDVDYEAQKITKDKNFTLFYPDDRDAVVAKLNDGLFEQLLQVLRKDRWNHGIIILAAMTMQLGGKIPKKDIADIRRRLGRMELFDEAKDQMRKGSKEYKNNGEAWDFGSLSLVETAEKAWAEEKASKEAKDKEVGQDGAKEFKDTNTAVKALDSEGKKSEHVKPSEEESEKPKKRQKVSANKDEV
ncbi:MAG: hypothetical protein Q9213_003355 [Squamulea squamosa]